MIAVWQKKLRVAKKFDLIMASNTFDSKRRILLLQRHDDGKSITQIIDFNHQEENYWKFAQSVGFTKNISK